MSPAPGGEPEARLGDLVADHFRRVEVLLLARVLASTLVGALPPSVVRANFRRTVADRLTGRAGQLLSVTIYARGIALTLTCPDRGEAKAGISAIVDGVVQSPAWVSIPTWLDQLARVLNELTADDEAARRALQRVLAD